jgi:hypothetical protein
VNESLFALSNGVCGEMAPDVGGSKSRPGGKMVVLDGSEQCGWHRQEQTGMEEFGEVTGGAGRHGYICLKWC